MIGSEKSIWNTISSLGERLEDSRIPMWLLGLFICADCGLLIGNNASIKSVIITGKIDGLQSFYIGIAGVFNSVFALFFRSVTIYVFYKIAKALRLFSSDKLMPNNDMFSYRELLAYSIKNDSRVLSTLYKRLVHDRKARIQYKNYLFSLAILIIINLCLHSSLLNSNPPVGISLSIIGLTLILAYASTMDDDEYSKTDISKYYREDFDKEKRRLIFPEE